MDGCLSKNEWVEVLEALRCASRVSENMQGSGMGESIREITAMIKAQIK